MQNLSFWQKQEKPLFPDLLWNIPEQKSGLISVIGGNSQSFSTSIHVAEFLTQTYPLKSVNILLPDSLKNQLPSLPGVIFLPATDSGSFARSPLLVDYLSAPSLLIGDFSKNSATCVALSEAIIKTIDSNSTENLTQNSAQNPEKSPLLLTRDTIDLLLPEMNTIINHPHLFFIGSLAQVQKLFRAVYYPKVLMLSMPLVPVLEALHKFTLSYPCTILTFHQGQILTTFSGKVISTPLDRTPYSPISLWNGNLACHVAALNLFAPGDPLAATSAAILQP